MYSGRQNANVAFTRFQTIEDLNACVHTISKTLTMVGIKLYTCVRTRADRGPSITNTTAVKYHKNSCEIRRLCICYRSSHHCPYCVCPGKGGPVGVGCQLPVELIGPNLMFENVTDAFGYSDST